MTLAVGDEAPNFVLSDQDGADFDLASFRGQRVVLFFYPRDDTSGCTLEAKGFSQAIANFHAHNCVVAGISADTVASHAKFRTKHDLTVPLVADPDHVALRAYGVWQEKKMYGRTFMGIVRSTFLIGPNGVIEHVWPKVKVAGHVDAVLAEVADRP